MSRKELRKDLKRLLNGYLKQELSKEEYLFLDEYYDFFNQEGNVLDQLEPEAKEHLSASLFSQVKKRTKSTSKFQLTRAKGFWRAAAAVIILFSVTTFVYLNRSKTTQLAQQHLIAPASNKATLQLADGTIIILDSNNNKVSSNQDSVRYSIQNGALTYQGNTSKNLFNTIKTARGGLYHLTLSDGTQVWLNAASSLQYPIAFNGKERMVRLSGEAYMEVAKNKNMPFVVDVDGKGIVEVVGTHFNINAYTDNTTFKTTLLEGKVNVTPIIDKRQNDSKTVSLSPGQQATVASNIILVSKDVDMEAVMAWRNNMFYFDEEPLESIMEEFARWYDIDVVYQCSQETKRRRYFMLIKRSVSLTEVLKSLQESGVKYEIDNRKLTIK